MTSDHGRVADATGLSSPTEPHSSGSLGPSRWNALCCAIANARYALEFWDRETGPRVFGQNWTMLERCRERGRQECETLREWEAIIYPIAYGPRERDAEERLDGNAATERADRHRPADEMSVVVSQADRLAAASCAARAGHPKCHTDDIREGLCDDLPLVRAFARHRTEALSSLLADKERLEREVQDALRECGKWAREAGEAKGRLEMSEAAGIVEGWKSRAEAAEARLTSLREALEAWPDEIELYRVVKAAPMRINAAIARHVAAHFEAIQAALSSIVDGGDK